MPARAITSRRNGLVGVPVEESNSPYPAMAQCTLCPSDSSFGQFRPMNGSIAYSVFIRAGPAFDRENAPPIDGIEGGYSVRPGL
jgi:hypothetical protein